MGAILLLQFLFQAFGKLLQLCTWLRRKRCILFFTSTCMKWKVVFATLLMLLDLYFVSVAFYFSFLFCNSDFACDF